MSRMSVFALAAALAMGGVSLATEASARGAGGHAGGHGMGGGMGGGGHWSGGAHMGVVGGGPRWSGGWGGGMHHHHFFLRRGFGVGIYGPYFGPDYYPYPTSYEDDCWQLRHVPTRRGWRWRNVNVCAVPY